MQTQVRVTFRKILLAEEHLLAAGYAKGKYADRIDACPEQNHEA